MLQGRMQLCACAGPNELLVRCGCSFYQRAARCDVSDAVRAGDGGTDAKTGGGAGGGRVGDANMFVKSDKNGQDQE